MSKYFFAHVAVYFFVVSFLDIVLYFLNMF